VTSYSECRTVRSAFKDFKDMGLATVELRNGRGISKSSPLPCPVKAQGI